MDEETSSDYSKDQEDESFDLRDPFEGAETPLEKSWMNRTRTKPHITFQMVSLGTEADGRLVGFSTASYLIPQHKTPVQEEMLALDECDPFAEEDPPSPPEDPDAPKAQVFFKSHWQEEKAYYRDHIRGIVSSHFTAELIEDRDNCGVVGPCQTSLREYHTTEMGKIIYIFPDPFAFSESDIDAAMAAIMANLPYD